MRMGHNKRFRLGLYAGLILSVLIFFVIAVKGLALLSSQSKKMVNLKQQSNVLNAQLTNLAAAKKEVEQYKYFNDVAKTVIPADKDQAQAVLDLFQFAAQSGISLQSITFPASTLGARAVQTTAQDATSASPQKVVSQAKPVQGIKGLYSIELTMSPETGANVPDSQRATYPKLLDFLNRIERNRRTAQITQVNITPIVTDNKGPSPFINFTLTTNIFIKP